MPSKIENILGEIQRELDGDLQKNGSTSAQYLSEVGAPSLAMPEYVEHHPGATEIGKLSAEAVVREYEFAAKEIESLGAGLIERIKQCQAVTQDAFSVTKELKEIAERYRQEAKRVFLEIESCSLMTAEVRKTCTELKDKLAVPPTVERAKPKKK
jgi:hypothetical protein